MCESTWRRLSPLIKRSITSASFLSLTFNVPKYTSSDLQKKCHTIAGRRPVQRRRIYYTRTSEPPRIATCATWSSFSTNESLQSRRSHSEVRGSVYPICLKRHLRNLCKTSEKMGDPLGRQSPIFQLYCCIVILQYHRKWNGYLQVDKIDQKAEYLMLNFKTFTTAML